jgi:hypothetical protein
MMKINIQIVVFLLLSMSLILVSCKSDEQVVPLAGDFIQTSPEALETGVSPLATFKWEAALNAESYNLVISINANFTEPAIDISGITETNYTLKTGLAPNTRYCWKVIAETNGGSKTASNAGISFRIKAETPEPSAIGFSYYVSPDGDDNPGRGTQANPFKTLAFAASMVPAACNDTIFLSAGTFNETEPSIIPIGVNIKGAGESLTILKSSGVRLPATVTGSEKDYKLWYDGSMIQLVSPHNKLFRNPNSAVIAPENGNQTISGFTIDGDNKSLKAGVWVENRNNITMHHVTFTNLAQRGAVFAPGYKNWYVYPEFYMTNIKIHDCTFTNSGKDLADETLGNLDIAQLNGAEIYNITINDNEGYGIKFIYDGYFKNVKIHDCQITVNESDSKWGEDIAIELWNVGPGNEIYNINCNTWLSIVNHPEIFVDQSLVKNMEVYNVKMIDQDGNSGKEAVEVGAPNVEVYDSYFENKGIGIAIWDMGRENITVRNNIFYNSVIKDNWSGAPAVYIDNSRDWDFSNIRIYNNVFDNFRVGVIIKGNRILDVDTKNNVFMGITVADIESSAQQLTFNNNLKFNALSPDWIITVTTISKTGNLSGNPDFLLTGDKWDVFYQASSQQSTVVDKGADVGIPYKGTAPDIGRWEF